jgi:hypothetical protein
MLVGSIMIGARFGREDHGSISDNAFGRELEPLDVKTRPELWTTRVHSPRN